MKEKTEEEKNLVGAPAYLPSITRKPTTNNIIKITIEIGGDDEKKRIFHWR